MIGELSVAQLLTQFLQLFRLRKKRPLLVSCTVSGRQAAVACLLREVLKKASIAHFVRLFRHQVQAYLHMTAEGVCQSPIPHKLSCSIGCMTVEGEPARWRTQRPLKAMRSAYSLLAEQINTCQARGEQMNREAGFNQPCLAFVRVLSRCDVLTNTYSALTA